MLLYRRLASLIQPLRFFKKCPKCTSTILAQNRLNLSKIAGIKCSKQVQFKSTFAAGDESKEKIQDKKRKERKEIFDEIRKGYFADFHEFRRTGGKRFFALDKPFDEKDAVMFPYIKGRNLMQNVVDLQQEFPNHVTLILMWFRAIGQGMCDKYRLPFLQHFNNHPQVQYYEVNVVDGWFFKLLKPFIERSLRKTKPEDRHDNYLCYFGNTQLIKDQLMENIIVGHVFLVDSKGCVRWRAHADPTSEEINFMLQSTELLLKDLKRKSNFNKAK